MTKPPLQMFEANNYKAIRASGKIRFDWLTCFIGNNGVGKSSLIEALETFRDVASKGLDKAMRRWRGFEHVWNHGVERKVISISAKPPAKNLPLEEDLRVTRKFLESIAQPPRLSDPMRFSMDWSWKGHSYKLSQSISQGPRPNEVFITDEVFMHKSRSGTERIVRDGTGRSTYESTDKQGSGGYKEYLAKQTLDPGTSLLGIADMDDWQFLRLNPEKLGQPKAQSLATRKVRLASDGSNIAEYLNEIRDLDQNAFAGILASIAYVLPYAHDLQPAMTSELERTFYLNLTEENFKVPGWLLSSGTLRIVAILACLRHPSPPPLLVIEEIENGLDPRTIHLIVEEIRAAIVSNRTQVIMTTHSPYLLDLLDLSHIVVVEREDGQPIFNRPDVTKLAEWTNKFAPGKLYTMGRLKKGESR